MLSAVAGWVDAVAFLVLGGYFVSFMSGNTTRGAVNVVDGGTWWIAGAIIGAFVLGVFASTLVQRLVGSRQRTVALMLASVMLLAASLGGPVGGPLLGGFLLAAGTGAINTVFARNGESTFGVTYMTGALVKAAQGAARAALGDHSTAWLRYLALWAAIAAGAIGGALAFGLVAFAALWPATAVIVALTGWVAWREGPSRRPVGPR